MTAIRHPCNGPPQTSWRNGGYGENTMFSTIYTYWHQKCNEDGIGNISTPCVHPAGKTRQDKTRQDKRHKQSRWPQVRSGQVRSQWLLFPCRWLLFLCRRQSCCISCNCNTLNLKYDKTRQDKPPQAKQVTAGRVRSGQVEDRDVSRTSQVRAGQVDRQGITNYLD